jgi:hypothetical protein
MKCDPTKDASSRVKGAAVMSAACAGHTHTLIIEQHRCTVATQNYHFVKPPLLLLLLLLRLAALRGGGSPSAQDTTMDLGLKLCTVIIYITNYILTAFKKSYALC